MYKERKHGYIKERKHGYSFVYKLTQLEKQEEELLLEKQQKEKEEKLKEEEREYYRYMTSVYASMNF